MNQKEKKNNQFPNSRFETVLHVFELIDTSFGVALADLPQRLVLVTALLDILFMQFIHGRFFRLILGAGQIFLQHL